MPYLDCSDVLLDPDFCDSSLSCQRTSVTTNNQGIAVPASTTIGFAGVVTSDQGINLERSAVGEHASGSISIVTRTKLIAKAPGITADIISWNGARYTVVNIDPYPKYGIGFYQAICDLLPLSG